LTEVRHQRARRDEARAAAALGRSREALAAHEAQPDPVQSVEGKAVKAAWLETIVTSRNVAHDARAGLERDVIAAHIQLDAARLKRRESGRAWGRTERYLQIERTTRAEAFERAEDLTQDDFNLNRYGERTRSNPR
ncbi:MAG: hypothetical protein CSA66_06210, partial [Proteobacteria bacterium]